MKYKVHRLEVNQKNMQDRLENFLNQIKGKIVSIVPNVKPTFLMMGGTARVDFLLVVEKIQN